MRPVKILRIIEIYYFRCSWHCAPWWQPPALLLAMWSSPSRMWTSQCSMVSICQWCGCRVWRDKPGRCWRRTSSPTPRAWTSDQDRVRGERVTTVRPVLLNQATVLLMLLLQDTLDPTMLTMEHTLEDTEPSDGTLTTLSSWDLEVMDTKQSQPIIKQYLHIIVIIDLTNHSPPTTASVIWR